MFGTIRRHQKWLWIVISTVTIVSFVAFFSPNNRRQGGWVGPKDYVGSINGRPVTRDEYARIYREAGLRYLFNYGTWPENDSRQSDLLEREVHGRILLLEKMKELNIQVSEAAVAQWIRDLPAFHDQSGKQFQLEAYNHFINNSLPARGLSQADFERFARHEVGIQHLAALAGIAGKIIPPQEAEKLFRRENEEAEAEAVFFTSTNYLSQVTVDPAAIATYYTNQQALYRIPQKIQVSYVRFAASNYWADADQTLSKNTNLNQILESTYQQRGTNTFKDANGNVLSAEASKEKIKEEVRHEFAMQEARRKAFEFASELFEIKDKTNGLEKLAAAKGMPVEVSDPFTEYDPPRNMKVSSAFAQAAGKLTAEEPVPEQPLEGEDGYYLPTFKRIIPSEVPPLSSIQERVTQDYKNSKAMEMARAAGRDLAQAVTNGLAQGKSFQEVVASKNASAVVLPPFSRKTTTLTGIPNRGDASHLITTVFTLAPGKASDFVDTRTGGFVVYLKSITPVADAKVKAELPEFSERLRQSRQYEAFKDWFLAQEKAAQIVLPGDRQRTAAK